MRPRSHAAMVYWLCRLDPENRGYFTMRDWGRDEYNKQARQAAGAGLNSTNRHGRQVGQAQ